MKCPKCQYLGFETGDRCKNCGYDFSLLEFRPAVGRDDPLTPWSGDSPNADAWDRFAASPSDQRAEPPLPLFALTADDQPLVRLPVTPRRPLAVRRTPEHPHLRTSTRQVDAPEPAVQAAPGPEPELDLALSEDATPHGPSSRSVGTSPSTGAETPSSPQRRLLAASIDYSLLVGIDAAIVYFTLRMAGLEMSDWRLLPIVPLALFLGVIAFAYVGVFTAIGGQTIGKMAARIRVVSAATSDNVAPFGPVQAFTRTAAVMVSWLTGGLGFLPALVGEHRTLHDRLSRTRVVNLV